MRKLIALCGAASCYGIVVAQLLVGAPPEKKADQTHTEKTGETARIEEKATEQRVAHLEEQLRQLIGSQDRPETTDQRQQTTDHGFGSKDENGWLEGTTEPAGDATPADVLIGKTFHAGSDWALKTGTMTAFPAGAIVMWSGTLASIPAGWALCDGTQGTPDLQNRFIYGVDSLTNPGTTGGASLYSLTVAQMPAHTHSATIHPAGAHSHTYTMSVSRRACSASGRSRFSCSQTSHTSTVPDHTHMIDIEEVGANAPIDNRPAYFKLAFIMKLYQAEKTDETARIEEKATEQRVAHLEEQLRQLMGSQNRPETTDQRQQTTDHGFGSKDKMGWFEGTTEPAGNATPADVLIGKTFHAGRDWALETGTTTALPAGVIVMWSGTLVSIPEGWALCDGTQGTPDLQNRFIYGVDSLTNPGTTGGASLYSLTVAQMPAHTHSATIHPAGAHSHTYRKPRNRRDCSYTTMNRMTSSRTSHTSTVPDHTHMIDIEEVGANAPIDNRPAYFKLAFIMKIYQAEKTDKTARIEEKTTEQRIAYLEEQLRQLMGSQDRPETTDQRQQTRDHWFGSKDETGWFEGTTEPAVDATPADVLIGKTFHAGRDWALETGTTTALPAGVIVMWSGTLVSIPEGWALCDGTQRTPDLQNRFIYGVDSLTNPGTTGGASLYSLTVAQMPAHTHSATIHPAGAHSHTYRKPRRVSVCSWTCAWRSASAATAHTSSVPDHTHMIDIEEVGANAPIDNRPAYFKLAFIMKL